MRRSIHFFRVGLGRLLYSRIPIPTPHLGKVLASLSILGVAGLGYVFGAAVMFFQLPSSEFLYQAFTGSKAWHERRQPAPNPFIPPLIDEREGVPVDKPGQTYDAFTPPTMTHTARP